MQKKRSQILGHSITKHYCQPIIILQNNNTLINTHKIPYTHRIVGTLEKKIDTVARTINNKVEDLKNPLK